MIKGRIHSAFLILGRYSGAANLGSSAEGGISLHEKNSMALDSRTRYKLFITLPLQPQPSDHRVVHIRQQMQQVR